MKYLAFCTIIFIFLGIGRTQTLTELRAIKITNVDSDVLFSNAKTAEAMDYLASIGVHRLVNAHLFM